MKRLLVATAALAGIALVNQGLAQVGPGDQATLRMPWDQKPAQANPTAGAFSPGFSGTLPQLPSYQPQEDPNRELFVNPEHGPWLICVNCYIGPESAKVSREIVMDLRDRYKLPAYVFSKHEEERRKEFERVKKAVEDYRKTCVEQHLPVDPHYRVRMLRFENEYAVLVGNYPDADSVRAALDKLRKLAPDPKLCYVKVAETDSADPFKLPKADDKKNVTFVNPFNSAFVVHNPAIKLERPAEWDKQDLAALQKLNRAEKYNLLNCKKPFTLVVKQFLLPIETRSSSGNVFGKMNPFSHQSDADVPAQNARNMAEFLQKTTHLDAFVLHTKYASMVTVGAFDSLDDPSLRSTQETLKNQYKIPMPVPMAVPR